MSGDASAATAVSLATVTLQTIEGDEASLGSFVDRPTIVFCWGSWCHCRAQLPLWEAWHERNAEAIGLVSVAIELQGAPAAEPWLREAGATFPSLVDTNCSLPLLGGFQMVPTGLFLDPGGRLLSLVEGTFDLSDASIRRQVEQFALAGQAPDRHQPPPDDGETAAVAEHLRRAAALLAAGRNPDACVELDAALALQPHNRVIQKQRWAIEYPERFVPEIDKLWQKAQRA
jgi:hypothetical protein